jgi:hypothetical protein
MHYSRKLTRALYLPLNIARKLTAIQGVPIDIFDFDISVHKPAEKRDLGSCAFASS